jgi:hypothetical protein
MTATSSDILGNFLRVNEYCKEKTCAPKYAILF